MRHTVRASSTANLPATTSTAYVFASLCALASVQCPLRARVSRARPRSVDALHVPHCSHTRIRCYPTPFVPGYGGGREPAQRTTRLQITQTRVFLCESRPYGCRPPAGSTIATVAARTLTATTASSKPLKPFQDKTFQDKITSPQKDSPPRLNQPTLCALCHPAAVALLAVDAGFADGAHGSRRQDSACP